MPAGGNETLGLQVTADASAFDAAFKQAEAAARSLGGETKKATDQLDKALDGWAKKSAAAGALFGNQGRQLGGIKVAIDNVVASQEKMGKGWDRVATGLNSVLEIINKFSAIADQVSELVHFNAELENMRARVPVERLRMMQEATEGAVTKIDLMKFSMRAMSGELRVTQQGLDVVLRAANTLSDQGFGDTLEIAEKLMSSLRRGSSRELREFGIALDDTANKNANLNKIMREFQKLATTEVPVNETLKEIERVQAATKDWLDSLKAGLGQVLTWLIQKFMEISIWIEEHLPSPAGTDAHTGGKTIAEKIQLETQAATAEEIYADPEKAARNNRFLGDLWGSGHVTPDDILAQQYFLTIQARKIAQLAAIYRDRAATEAWSRDRKRLFDWVRARSANTNDLIEGQLEDEAAKTRRGTGREPPFLAPGQFLYDLERDTYPARQQGIGALRGVGSFLGGRDVSGLGFEYLGGDRSRGVGGAIVAGAVDAEQQRKRDAFQAELQDRTTLVGGAFDTLTQGISAAIDAAITGSDNIGKAFMKASAMALKAIAIESAVRAVYETGLGFASIALGPIGGVSASGHFKAAAVLAAAAVAAGAGAAALGGASGAFSGGGGASPSTPPGGGNIAPASSNAQQPPTQIILQVGDGFVGKPDELAQALADRLNHAQASGRARIVTSAPGAVTFK